MAITIQTKAMPGFNSVALPLDSLEQVFGYTGDNLTTVTVEYQGVTYVQTLTYTGANVTSVSQFVPQP